MGNHILEIYTVSTVCVRAITSVEILIGELPNILTKLGLSFIQLLSCFCSGGRASKLGRQNLNPDESSSLLSYSTLDQCGQLSSYLGACGGSLQSCLGRSHKT